jgi:hypothetical protein
MLLDCFCYLVVGFNGQGNGRSWIEDLHSGSGQHQQLHVDAARVHVGDAPGAEVDDAPSQVEGALGGRVQVVAPQAVEARVPRLGPGGEDLLVALEHLGRAPRFLGGDALVGGHAVAYWGWIFAISA